jgi:hypothetical protein
MYMQLKLEFFNNDKLDIFINSLFDETGRRIEKTSWQLDKSDGDYYHIMKGLDRVKFISPRIKGLMDIRIETNEDFLELKPGNMFVVRGNKYDFY